MDKERNIVLFPIGKDKFLSMIMPDGKEVYSQPCSEFPIELPFPYTVDELAEKISLAFELFEKYSGRDPNLKPTSEERYYKVKGFKNAMRSKKYFSIRESDSPEIEKIIKRGNRVSLMLPLKRGYGYNGIEDIKLPDDATFRDFAQAVIDLSNLDLESKSEYKIRLKECLRD